jgi:hypothetical protein
LLAAIARRGERHTRLVPGPVGKVLEPSERSVDSWRTDLKAVAPLDRVGEIKAIRKVARDLLAIFDVELPGVGTLGHDLQRRVGCAADHHHAHEIVAEAPHLGLYQPLKTGNVGHARSTLSPKVSRTGAVGPQPQASGDVEERAAI